MNRFSMIEICICGEQIERFLNLCSYHNIKLYEVRKQDDSCYVKISAFDFFLLKTYAKKTKVTYKLVKKSGYYFRIKKMMRRKVFMILPFLCLLLLILSSEFLWNVHIDGNRSITTDMTRDFLQKEGIYYGIPLRKISIQKLKTNFRKMYPQVTWVSMYLEGTTLRISMKEHEMKQMNSYSESFSENLVAPVSGIIDSVLVRKGTLQVKEGMEVNKGDVLILGKVDVPSEDGTIKSTSYCKADGDIYLLYEYPIKEKLSLNYITKTYTGNFMNEYEFTWRNERLNLWKKKKSYKKYDIVSENMEIALFTILNLPIKIYKNTYFEYDNVEEKYTLEEAQNILENKISKIMQSLEEKGVQIIEKNVKIKSNSVQTNLEGNLLLRIKCDEYVTLEEDS